METKWKEVDILKKNQNQTETKNCVHYLLPFFSLYRVSELLQVDEGLFCGLGFFFIAMQFKYLFENLVLESQIQML